MRKQIQFAAAIVALFITIAVPAQVRGRGRLQGMVTNKETGKAVAGATVTVSGGNTKPIVVQTNAKGQWSALGLTSGTWDIDIEMAGFEPARGTVSMSELQMVPPLKSELAPKAEEVVEVPAGPAISNVSQTVIDAVNEAQALMKIAVGDDVDGIGATEETVKANNKRAAELVEGALPQIPTDTPERLQIRDDLQPLLAQAYYRAGDVAKATGVLKALVAADPANTTNALLLTNLYLESGLLAEGKTLLETLPAGAVTEPTVYLNVGILFLNKDSAADAVAYFDKAIALDTTKPEGYYYRGLAHVQTKNIARARADFEKVMVLAPDSPEARDSAQMLAGLK